MGKVGFKYHNSNSTIYAGIIILLFIGIDMFTRIVILRILSNKQLYFYKFSKINNSSFKLEQNEHTIREISSNQYTAFSNDYHVF